MERQLPDELWIQIFELALDEDILLQPTLPTSMSQYAWYIHTNPDTLEEEWALRSPQEALAVIQRENWDLKRTLSKTCRRFNALVSPYLYRCLSFDDPSLIPRFNRSVGINRIGDEKTKEKVDAKFGRYTKRLYVAHSKLQDDALAEAFSRLVSHTPSLQSLIIDSHPPFSLFPSPSAFTSLAQALTSTPVRKTLHTLHIHAVPYESLSHLILTFDSLRRNLVVAHVHISPPKGEEDVKLGASGGLHVVLSKLRQLSLSGRFGALMDQMICGDWDFAELRALSVDVGSGRVEMPDLVCFLCGGSTVTAGGESAGGVSAGDGDNMWEGIGKNLWLLDIQASALQPELNIPKILDTCTQLRTFGFNADWRFPIPGNHPPGHNQQQEQSVSQITLPGAPHHHIHTIILHGLNYAFNSGLTTPNGGGGFMAHYVRRSNDMNFAALTKEQFPALKRVRVGNGKVLQELEKNGGPTSGSAGAEPAAAPSSGNGIGEWATVFSQATAALNHPSSTNPYGAGGGMDRWERWYDQCVALGVRLEDCTGDVLGELPPPLGDDEETDSDWDSEEGSYETEEEEVAEALLSPSDSDSESSTPDLKGKGKENEWSPPVKRRNRPRLSIEETRPYIRQVREMTNAIPPPPTPPDSPKKPSNSKFKFESGASLSKPHVQELRRLVEECRLFEAQGERENRTFMRTRGMAALMGADDEDVF
ncbi:hypothetical protein E1B28_005832 [Marasmius oreades]|uniref:Uncharacterized protein n=1 Tax=Marasmius oreades TaxID=181124 RepID=A0A9P7UUN5_9AGAR|nr:uncharacterized protein E1B28_005832 [Marasmius oreades]KAG7095042.1 hypothetical protein E1B28_005832 [Marasmius oreades]